MIAGDGRNTGTMLEVVTGMNRFSTVTCGKAGYVVTSATWWVDMVRVWRSLLMAKGEEGERLSHRTEGDRVH